MCNLKSPPKPKARRIRCAIPQEGEGPGRMPDFAGLAGLPAAWFPSPGMPPPTLAYPGPAALPLPFAAFPDPATDFSHLLPLLQPQAPAHTMPPLTAPLQAGRLGSPA